MLEILNTIVAELHIRRPGAFLTKITTRDSLARLTITTMGPALHKEYFGLLTINRYSAKYLGHYNRTVNHELIDPNFLDHILAVIVKDYDDFKLASDELAAYDQRRLEADQKLFSSQSPPH